jgi:hypothetical protein
MLWKTHVLWFLRQVSFVACPFWGLPVLITAIWVILRGYTYFFIFLAAHFISHSNNAGLCVVPKVRVFWWRVIRGISGLFHGGMSWRTALVERRRSDACTCRLQSCTAVRKFSSLNCQSYTLSLGLGTFYVTRGLHPRWGQELSQWCTTFGHLETTLHMEKVGTIHQKPWR